MIKKLHKNIDITRNTQNLTKTDFRVIILHYMGFRNPIFADNNVRHERSNRASD